MSRVWEKAIVRGSHSRGGCLTPKFSIWSESPMLNKSHPALLDIHNADVKNNQEPNDLK